MSTELTWKFDENRTGEPEGFHNAGISHFTSNRLDSLVREVIQNSLDARDDLDEPVRITFARDRVKIDLVDSKNLMRAIVEAVNSPHNDARYKESMLASARDLTKGKNVLSLRIEDANTSGADDESDGFGRPSKWDALTKGSGLNVKDARDAGGSFGLGKFAAFAATDIRTVLYSTAWRKSSNDKLQHRFIGKTILVSRKDGTGIDRRAIGYLCGDDFQPALNAEVPERFRMENAGTTLWILRQLESDWDTRIRQSIVSHYFHAIIHGGLSATVNRVKITGDNLEKFLLEGNERHEAISDFISVSRLPSVETTSIDGIGEINLRIKVYRGNNSNRKRQIALVRDAGMMITDQRNDMGLSGIKMIPSHWHGFTAIVECLSHGKESLLRDSESPKHNEISPDQIDDEKHRKLAEVAFRELGQWLREMLQKHAEPSGFGEEENASEVALYLPIEAPQGNGSAKGGGNSSDSAVVAISSIRQQDRPPPNRPRIGGRKRKPATVPGGDGAGNNEGSLGGGSGLVIMKVRLVVEVVRVDRIDGLLRVEMLQSLLTAYDFRTCPTNLLML